MVKNTVQTITSAAEQKLKLEKRAEHLKSLISLCTNDHAAKLSFEAELTALRRMYKDIVPDAELVRRTNYLQKIRAELGLVTRDNRAAYSRQTVRAVSKLCGVPV